MKHSLCCGIHSPAGWCKRQMAGTVTHMMGVDGDVGRWQRCGIEGAGRYGVGLFDRRRGCARCLCSILYTRPRRRKCGEGSTTTMGDNAVLCCAGGVG